MVTSSVAGKFGAPNSATYTASKHALLGYFETLRAECTIKGIRVTTVCPGPVQTPLVERSFHTEAFADEVAMSSKITTGKIEVKRCAYLMGVAMANRLSEVWISLKPILWFLYLSQHTPILARFLLCELIPPEKQMSIRDGGRRKPRIR
jgi:dehydrogenase/reductase SDR family protein 7